MFSRSFCRPHKLLKMFENVDPNTGRFSLMERNFHGSLSAYNQISVKKKKRREKKRKEEIFQANHYGHILEKSDTSLRGPPGRSSGDIPEVIVIIGNGSTVLVLLLNTIQWDRMWRWMAVMVTLCRPWLKCVFMS